MLLLVVDYQHFALSYFLNICRNMVRVHMSTLCWKIEIYREVGAPPKHQIMGRIAG